MVTSQIDGITTWLRQADDLSVGREFIDESSRSDQRFRHPSDLKRSSSDFLG
jgi:hypothetical protein